MERFPEGLRVDILTHTHTHSQAAIEITHMEPQRGNMERLK